MAYSWPQKKVASLAGCVMRISFKEFQVAHDGRESKTNRNGKFVNRLPLAASVGDNDKENERKDDGCKRHRI